MTRAQLEKQVIRILRRNRKARPPRFPFSLYGLAKQHGLPRQYFTDVLHGRKTIGRVVAILESVVQEDDGHSAA